MASKNIGLFFKAMSSPAVRAKISGFGFDNIILGILPTQGNNPWVDGVNYDGKLYNKGSDLISSLNFNPLKNYFIELGAYPAGPLNEKPVEILVSFVDDPGLPGSEKVKNLGQLNAWPSNLKNTYLKAFEAWREVANIEFAEVEEGTPANIEYFLINIDPSSGVPLDVLGSHDGILDPPLDSPQTSWINANYFNDTTNSDPGYSFLEVAIHEIGHGIGMSHPHDGGLDPLNPSPLFVGLNPNFAAGDQFGVFGYGLFGLNQNPNTIMSYNRGLEFDEDLNPLPLPNNKSAGHAETPMALDIMNIQLKYGYNTKTRTGNDTYRLTGSPGNLSGWSSIWDAGGIDTINAREAQNNVVINLQAAPMNAYRPQSGQMSEQYNWEAIGVADSKSAEALQTIIDVVNAPGSLLGTSYKFALLAPAILEAPTEIKLESSEGTWGTQSFGDYFFDNVDNTDLIQSIIDVIDVTRGVSRLLAESDPSYREKTLNIELEQQRLLLESATNVGGYFSQVLKNQGGFTIAAGVEIENATGGAFADSITGNFLSNVLIGKLGDDTIHGLQGDDVINGGGGDDELNGGVGADRIVGGAGKNIFLSAEDGFVDTLVIKPDRDGGQNFDIVEGLDVFDVISISGVGAGVVSVRDISRDGLAGVGIFVGNNLEALYTGGTLTSQQIQGLVS